VQRLSRLNVARPEEIVQGFLAISQTVARFVVWSNNSSSLAILEKPEGLTPTNCLQTSLQKRLTSYGVGRCCWDAWGFGRD
jgi:hypothetical protein